MITSILISKTTNLIIDHMIMQMLFKLSSDVCLCNVDLQETSCPELETTYTARSQDVSLYSYISARLEKVEWEGWRTDWYYWVFISRIVAAEFSLLQVSRQSSYSSPFLP